MNRRTCLRAGGVAGMVGIAGCLGMLGGDDDTVLGPPEVDLGEPSYPTHGDELPDFEVVDVSTGETLSRADVLAEDRVSLTTFIFSECPDGQCQMLLTLLAGVQQVARDAGFSDDVALIAITFDPDTDTPEVLQEEAQVAGLELDADNAHMLRPESNAAARDLVEERFGVPYELTHEDHGDHDHGSGGNETQDDGSGSETQSGVHPSVAILANGEGIVERAYQNPPGISARDVEADIEAVVEG